MTISLPDGFSAHVGNIGIRDDTADFTVIAAERPVDAAAVFTRSRFAGPSVTLSQANVANGRAQAVVVISKNANVATGADGAADAQAVATGVANALACDPTEILLASTGVIGRRYPMDRVDAYLATLSTPFQVTDATTVATAIMTTDTHEKVAEASAGAARVVGIAKGVGMIEPNMATMLTFLFTDAQVEADELGAMFRRSVDDTFNCLSVDTDTSTSDTAAILASGAAGPVDAGDLESAIYDVCLELTRMLAFDGEGAETLLVVAVTGGRDRAQAKRVAKAIVNSPLVKTAVHGADPNWGRVAMAIGKCEDDLDIDQDAVTIRFGNQEVYPTLVDEVGLSALESYMGGDEVHIHVDLHIGSGASTVYGCDLTDGYVRINADYTT